MNDNRKAPGSSCIFVALLLALVVLEVVAALIFDIPMSAILFVSAVGVALAALMLRGGR